MKKLLKLSALSLVLLGISSNSYAASGASASGNISATVASAISISKIADMSFGRFVANTSSPSTILINATGTVRTAGIGSPTLIATPTPTAGQFRVTGDNSAAYTITLPSSVTLSNGSNTMTVDTFVSSPSASGVLDSTTGAQDVYIGATLHVGTSQATGNYTGTYTVTVDYS